MRLVVEIPFKYPIDHLLYTEDYYGYGVENVTGGDIPYVLGRDLHVSSKVYIYKFIDGLKEHIVVFKNKPENKIKDFNESVCLYSKYYYPKISPILCRYLPNYSKVYSWITESEEKPFNSVWFDFIEHPYHSHMDENNKKRETYFNTFSDIDVISLLTSSYVKDSIHKHYNTNSLPLLPEFVLNKPMMDDYLKNRFNTSIINSNNSIKFEDKRLLDNINIDDVFIINKINTIPVRSLSCIYYPKEDRLVINNMELIVSVEMNDVIRVIKEILDVYCFEDRIELTYFNEEIFIKTKRQTIYINIPILDLCNSILHM